MDYIFVIIDNRGGLLKSSPLLLLYKYTHIRHNTSCLIKTLLLTDKEWWGFFNAIVPLEGGIALKV